MIAALYVEKGGIYYGLPDVDPWDEERDARLYAGPWPVVAHPPCARWSRLAGFTEARFGYKRSEDGGCFAAALRAVQTYGGVLEHPARSRAWYAFGLPIPQGFGWTGSLLDPGWSCYIEQSQYGHVVRKATWLYAVGTDAPSMRWSFIADQNAWGELTWTRPPGEGRKRVGAAALKTPIEFRDALLSLARSTSLSP